MIEQLKTTGRLERFVTSNRLRKKLEEFNYGIHTRLDKIVAAGGIVVESKHLQVLATTTTSNQQQTLSSSNNNNNEEDDKVDVIVDVLGKQFWEKYFGLEVFLVIFNAMNNHYPLHYILILRL